MSVVKNSSNASCITGASHLTTGNLIKAHNLYIKQNSLHLFKTKQHAEPDERQVLVY